MGRRSIPSAAASVLLLAGGLSLAPIPAAGGTAAWTPIAPESSYILSVTADAQTGQVYAVTINSGVYRSDDRGMTWVSASRGLPVSRSILALSPIVAGLRAGAGIAYAIVDGLLYRSIASADWEVVPGSPGSFLNLALSPATPRTVYAIIGQQVFRSVDAGTSWTLASPFSPAHPISLAADPGQPDLLYVWTSDGSFWSSRDGGAQWTLLATLSAKEYREALVVDPGTPSTLYVIENLKLLRSLDGGAHWSRSDGALPADGEVVTLAALGQPVPRLYAGVRRTPANRPALPLVYGSSDQGTTWQLVKRLPGIISVAVDPSHPRRLYVGTGAEGVLWSANFGAQWAQGRGLLDSYGQDVAPDPTTPGTLYLLADSRLQKSTDGGSTWTLLETPRIFGLTRVVADPKRAGTLYLAAAVFDEGPYSSLYKSVDGGATSEAIAEPLGPVSIEDLAIDPQDPRTLIVAGWTQQAACNPAYCLDYRHFQALRSADGGSTWTSFADTLVDPQADGSFTGVRFDPVQPQNVYLVGDDKNFRSTDGGVTWAAFRPTGGFLHDLATDPFQANVLYAVTPHLQKSLDGGQSWQLLSDPPGVAQSLTADRHHAGTLYALTNDQKVWISTDGAAHWASIGTGLPRVPIRSLTVDPSQPGHLFAVTVGYGGLYSYATTP